MEITNICPYCGGKMREGALPAYKYPLTWCPRNEQCGKTEHDYDADELFDNLR